MGSTWPLGELIRRCRFGMRPQGNIFSPIGATPISLPYLISRLPTLLLLWPGPRTVRTLSLALRAARFRCGKFQQDLLWRRRGPRIMGTEKRLRVEIDLCIYNSIDSFTARYLQSYPAGHCRAREVRMRIFRTFRAESATRLRRK